MPPTFVLSQDQTLQKFLLTAPLRKQLFFEFNLPLSVCDSKNLTGLPAANSGRLRSRLAFWPTWARVWVTPDFRRKPNPLKAYHYQLVKDRVESALADRSEMIPIRSASSASDSGTFGLSPVVRPHSIPPQCGGRGMLKGSPARVNPLEGNRAKKMGKHSTPPIWRPPRRCLAAG
jgi:hypothetical protein